MEMKDSIENVRNAFKSGKSKDLRFRERQLDQFIRMLNESEEDIVECLYDQLRKSKHESILYELEVLKSDAQHIRNNLRKYAKDEKLPTNLLAFLDNAWIRKEPFGVVLIIGAWNYPFLLTLGPLIGAIGAGNCAVIKPSEVAGKTARLISKLIPKYLDNDCYRVIEGDVEKTRAILKEPFDYIFFTGSPEIGKHVMEAASKNLTPLTLELGGKSPCYIDESSDFEVAAKRILWGKFMNSGQTCIAPDYILCSKSAEESFVRMAHNVVKEWYGTNMKGNKDIARIINKKHFNRLKNLLQTTKGTIVFGGNFDEDDLFIEPTIVVNVPEDDPLMNSELFGPICPVVRVSTVDQAIKMINSKPKPLSLYTFSRNDKVNKKILEQTQSGGVCVNDVMWHCGWAGLPFGGVGNSGLGNYHGRYSFDTFSHKRSVLKRSFGFLSEKLGEPRYPPYTNAKLKFFRYVIQYFEHLNLSCGGVLSHLLAAILGASILYGILYAVGRS